MEKSKHRYYGDIPFDELHNFIEPLSMNIDIPFKYISQLFFHEDEIENYFEDFCSKGYHYMSNLEKVLGNDIINIFDLVYTSHIDGYDFRFNPINIFNNIFSKLKLPYNIPYINLDNPDGMNYLKDYIRCYITDIKRTILSSQIIEIMDELNQNLDNICNIYNVVFDDELQDTIIPKTALYYLAYRSLTLYEETKDERYLPFAYEYIRHVSHMRTSPYPHSVSVPGRDIRRIWYSFFVNEYINEIGMDYIPNIEPYKLTNTEVYLAWDILTPGMVERELRDVVQKARAQANVDYEKYMKLFEMKMNYYLKSGYNKHIVGKYGLSGYVGFTYPNEYLVFDKFHNSITKDPTKKTILTHGEAIYALPSDRFSIVSGDKQTVLEERKMDDRNKKINHNETFINRLDPVVHGPNVSTSTFEEEIEKQKKRMLIKK